MGLWISRISTRRDMFKICLNLVKIRINMLDVQDICPNSVLNICIEKKTLPRISWKGLFLETVLDVSGVVYSGCPRCVHDHWHVKCQDMYAYVSILLRKSQRNISNLLSNLLDLVPRILDIKDCFMILSQNHDVELRKLHLENKIGWLFSTLQLAIFLSLSAMSPCTTYTT